MIHFTLYSRSYCHLCDDMRLALEDLVQSVPHQISMVDVDQDPDLLSLYDELVPVLFAKKANDVTSVGAGVELCHHHLDVEKVKAYCEK